MGNREGDPSLVLAPVAAACRTNRELIFWLYITLFESAIHQSYLMEQAG
jgi:hypothetical protein